MIADRRSSCGIEADNVPLHLVRICSAVGDHDSLIHVAGNHVAPTCARPAADRVVLCAPDDHHACGIVRQSGGSGGVQTNVVPLDKIAVRTRLE